ncbi:MAG: hypothetical protein AMJ84_03740 [Acidithiobacillales bacterium SM23_46]|nr:MAG: hypothetical protein AMJ84_03740 [Acidithiobacillales bacterium SM23_46]
MSNNHELANDSVSRRTRDKPNAGYFITTQRCDGRPMVPNQIVYGTLIYGGADIYLWMWPDEYTALKMHVELRAHLEHGWMIEKLFDIGWGVLVGGRPLRPYTDGFRR